MLRAALLGSRRTRSLPVSLTTRRPPSGGSGWRGKEGKLGQALSCKNGWVPGERTHVVLHPL